MPSNVESRLFYRLRAIGEDRVEMARDHRGLVISVRESGSFPAGRANLTDSAQSLFTEIGNSIVNWRTPIGIKATPKKGRFTPNGFSPNWESPPDRGPAVFGFSPKGRTVVPWRLGAAGYGVHPKVPNDSAANRSHNRRVDVIVLNAHTEDREEPLVGLKPR